MFKNYSFLIAMSILRDAVSDLALHLLAKQKIMVVKDIEREDIEFVCKTLGCRPIASLDHFTPEALGTAELAEEFQAGDSKFVKITGVQNPGRTVSILLRGSNKQVRETIPIYLSVHVGWVYLCTVDPSFSRP